MRPRAGSLSARQVLLVRAALARNGSLDDPLSLELLGPVGRRALPAAATALPHLPGVRGFASHLVTRTRFFDDQVDRALRGGCRQVVILGAGMDPRAWRLGRPGVAFYEVDLPAAQATKRRAAPQPHPRWVEHDLTRPGLADALTAAGWDAQAPTIVIAEGVFPYLTPTAISRLLTELADRCGPATRLAVLAPPDPPSPRRRRVESAISRLRGEPVRSSLAAPELVRLARTCGWEADGGDDTVLTAEGRPAPVQGVVLRPA